MKTHPITPKTKVAELLNHYPHLEDELIAIAPEFSKLKNPILRKTVAKVASLEQAARIAGINVGELVNKLRKSAGIEDIIEINEGDKMVFDEFEIVGSSIQESFDARPIIESGGHPMHEVISKMNALGNGKILELITPFVPIPLIEIGKNRGLAVKYVKASDDVVKTYFYNR